jgi:hypothetical protein
MPTLSFKILESSDENIFSCQLEYCLIIPFYESLMNMEEALVGNHDLKKWLNENKQEWLQAMYDDNEVVSNILSVWIDENITEQLLDITSISDLISLGFRRNYLDQYEIFLTELNDLKNQFSHQRNMTLENIGAHSLDLDNILIEVDGAPSKDLDKYVSYSEDFAIGGFHLSSHGIEVIPKFVTPLISGRNSVAQSKATSPINHEVPRFTRAATILLKQIGNGGSAEVTQGLYLPTMTMVAVSLDSHIHTLRVN